MTMQMTSYLLHQKLKKKKKDHGHLTRQEEETAVTL